MIYKKRILLLIVSAISFTLLFSGCVLKSNDDTSKVKNSKSKVVITEDNYFLHMVEMYYEPDTYLDAEIEVAGFFFKDEDMDDDIFLLARLFVDCCEDDAALGGFLSKYEGINTLVENNWYQVVGIFKIGPDYPYLEIKKIEEIPPPENPYISLSF